MAQQTHPPGAGAGHLGVAATQHTKRTAVSPTHAGTLLMAFTAASGAGSTATEGDGSKHSCATSDHELEGLDPKKARRKLANRQSAARSKERRQELVKGLQEQFEALKSEGSALNALSSQLSDDALQLSCAAGPLALQVQSLQTQLAALDVQRCELVKELQHAHTVLKLPGSIPEAPLPAPNTTPQHAPHPLPHLGVPAAATACQLTATVAEFVLASDTGDAGAQQAARGDVELAAVPRPWLALAQALQGATSVPQPPDLTPAGGRT